MIHCHTALEECEITKVLSLYNKRKGEKKETVHFPKFVKSQTYCRVRITIKNPIAIEKADVMPKLGYFVLRDEDRTIAAGKILKYKPIKANLPKEKQGYLEETDQGDLGKVQYPQEEEE